MWSIHVFMFMREAECMNLRTIFIIKNLQDSQVEFAENEIIFAIHLPIFVGDISQTYHHIPIPNNNSIIISDHSYRTLGAKSHQFESTVCPELDHIFFCRYYEDLNIIIQEINKEIILMTPAPERMKLRRSG